MVGRAKRNVEIFSVTDLNAGNHTLAINVLNDNEFWLDYTWWLMSFGIGTPP